MNNDEGVVGRCGASERASKQAGDRAASSEKRRNGGARVKRLQGTARGSGVSAVGRQVKEEKSRWSQKRGGEGGDRGGGGGGGGVQAGVEVRSLAAVAAAAMVREQDRDSNKIYYRRKMMALRDKEGRWH